MDESEQASAVDGADPAQQALTPAAG
jgi:hypothetical protein